MNYKFCHIVCVLVILSSCDNVPEMQIGPDQKVRYVIFSSFDPDCSSPDCTATFKIDNLKFFKDTQNAITSQNFPYQGRYVFFSSSEKLVENFLESIPQKLLSQDETRIGDCEACKMVYLEIGFDDKVRYWVISHQNEDQPKYLQNLVEQVQNTIAQLQNY